MNKNHEYLNLAVRCAKIGGKVIKKGFRQSKHIELKGFGNPVTEFDQESERKIVETIRAKYPAHSILTEEKLSSKGSAGIQWIIDPLDGTVNFTHQIPFVCVSIGVEVDGVVVCGVVYNPVLGECYTAVKGEGAFLNGRRISVSKIADSAKSLLVTGFPYEKEGRHESLTQTIKTINQRYTGFRRLGSAAMDLAYVARGSFEGFYEENLKPWDTAAGALLVEEAGGMVTDYYGGQYQVYKKTILATNRLAHEGMTDFLKTVKEPE